MDDELVHPRFTAVPLTSAVADLDFAAYLASPDVIRVHSAGRWPTDGFTPEANAALVRQHEREHAAGTSFAFTLLDPTRTESVGCLYVNPLRDYLARVGATPPGGLEIPSGAGMVTFWIRQDLTESDLPDLVVGAVDRWLRTRWHPPMHVFRVLPEEVSSCRAVEALGMVMHDLGLPDSEPPYRFYAAAPSQHD